MSQAVKNKIVLLFICIFISLLNIRGAQLPTVVTIDPNSLQVLANFLAAGSQPQTLKEQLKQEIAALNDPELKKLQDQREKLRIQQEVEQKKRELKEKTASLNDPELQKLQQELRRRELELELKQAKSTGAKAITDLESQIKARQIQEDMERELGAQEQVANNRQFTNDMVVRKVNVEKTKVDAEFRIEQELKQYKNQKDEVLLKQDAQHDLRAFIINADNEKAKRDYDTKLKTEEAQETMDTIVDLFVNKFIGRKLDKKNINLKYIFWEIIVGELLLNPYYVAKSSAVIAGGLFITFYTPGLLKEYVIHNFISPRPTILLPGSKIGLWDRYKRWKNSYQIPKMVFPTEVKEFLQNTVNVTKMIKQDLKKGLRRSYRNLLLWGPPGTGKTLFANILADTLDMDFCSITAGSLLQKDVGVKFLHEFAKIAEKSRYGIMLFIDEADALFVPRDMIDISSEHGLEHYKVLNHLLAMTGDGSSKFMLVAATNHAENIDEAMGRRFQDRIFMPLPDFESRIQIIKMYITKLMFDETSNGIKLVESAQRLFTKKMVESIAQATQELSAAEIKDIIVQILNLAIISQSRTVTETHVNTALEQGIKKKKDQEEDKKKRAAQKHNGAVVQLNVHSADTPKVTSTVPIVSGVPQVNG